jgi:hypothetical protein
MTQDFGLMFASVTDVDLKFGKARDTQRAASNPDSVLPKLIFVHTIKNLGQALIKY